MSRSSPLEAFRLASDECAIHNRPHPVIFSVSRSNVFLFRSEPRTGPYTDVKSKAIFTAETGNFPARLSGYERGIPTTQRQYTYFAASLSNLSASLGVFVAKKTLRHDDGRPAAHSSQRLR